MRSLRALAQSALIVAAVVPNALHSQQFMNNLFLSTYEYSQNLKLAQRHDLWLYPIVNLYLFELLPRRYVNHAEIRRNHQSGKAFRLHQ